jgi:hypothetical protein
MVLEDTSPEDPTFLYNLNKELDRDTNSKTVLKEKIRKSKRSTTREKALCSCQVAHKY